MIGGGIVSGRSGTCWRPLTKRCLCRSASRYAPGDREWWWRRSVWRASRADPVLCNLVWMAKPTAPRLCGSTDFGRSRCRASCSELFGKMAISRPAGRCSSFFGFVCLWTERKRKRLFDSPVPNTTHSQLRPDNTMRFTAITKETRSLQCSFFFQCRTSTVGILFSTAFFSEFIIFLMRHFSIGINEFPVDWFFGARTRKSQRETDRKRGNL